MGQINSVILKIASRCNLNCSYCYIYNHEDKSYLRRPHIIPDEVVVACARRIAEYSLAHSGATISVTLHGGEPTLVGTARFERIVALLQEHAGAALRSISLQSNGTLIDDKWASLISRLGVSVGISLDGTSQVHDTVRVDHKGNGSHSRTMQGIEHLREAGIEPRVLSVINPGHDGVATYRYFRSQHIKWMDFLLPDVSHDNFRSLYGHHGPTPVADFLLPILDEWLAEDEPSVDIRLFHELLQRLMGGPGLSDAFGNPLMSYLIVETDGSIEALDALRVCEDSLSDSGLNVITSGFDELSHGLPIVHRAVHEGFELARTCQSCPHRRVCGGGFLPHRFMKSNGFSNPSVWCRDITVLLERMADIVSAHEPA
jgi:uncharacterized protein